MATPARPSKPARPWALLWLGGIAAASWIPLLLVDSLPWASPTAPSSAVVTMAPPAKPTLSGATAASLPPPLPLLTSLAAAPPLGVPPSPWEIGEGPRSSLAPLPPQRQAWAAEPEVVAEPEAPAAAAFPPGRGRREPLPGSLLLGGPLTLASLHEKPMVPAARLEQTLRARSTDRLSAVPLHWRPTMEALVQGKNNVMPAEVVRLPAPHLQKPEEYPLAVQPDGVAETPVNPSPPSRQALERWAERQSPTPQGTVRPVVVVLEPLAAEQPAP
jgi:hypothetical protein